MTTLLIADDIDLNRKCLGLLLRRQGYEVLEADDGDQALWITRAEHPDVSLVDLFMPAMDGFEYARHVRSEPAIAHTPIIFVSSTFTPDAAAVLARVLGVRHLLQKSSAESDILKAVLDASSSEFLVPDMVVNVEEFNMEHARLIMGKLAKHTGVVLTTLSECLGGNGMPEKLPPGLPSRDP